FKRKKTRGVDKRTGRHVSKSPPLPPIGTEERLQVLRKLHRARQETLMRPPTLLDDGDDQASYPVCLRNGWMAGRGPGDERTVLAKVDRDDHSSGRRSAPRADVDVSQLGRLSLQARIYLLRKRAGLSLGAAAKLAGMTRTKWARLELAPCDPTIGTLR